MKLCYIIEQSVAYSTEVTNMQQAAAVREWRWETAGLPDEVGAVAAESRLLEEPGSEFVVLHFVDVFLPQSTFASKPIGYVRSGRLV
ncbi:hypothetical protein PBY51_020375 [Eleginops maclovinus]|uniref:Uncharacterized protein n=1 Tax=Eleginops maclovinus TaxID=56733 RepID=A0AAN7XPX7_ELEMC|nr:hypothetical protein PBY51_020375 [Eleginops maclovinus]